MAANTVIQFGGSFLDEEGITATSAAHVYADDGQTVLQVKTALAAWAAAMNLVSGAKITGTRARILGPGVVDATKPIAGSEVQEVAVLDFALGDTPYHWGLSVPAVLESLTSGGIAIAPTGDVAALITLMLGAVLGGHYSGLNNDALSAFQRSFQADRKRRTQLFRRSVNYTQPA